MTSDDVITSCASLVPTHSSRIQPRFSFPHLQPHFLPPSTSSATLSYNTSLTTFHYLDLLILHLVPLVQVKRYNRNCSFKPGVYSNRTRYKRDPMYFHTSIFTFFLQAVVVVVVVTQLLRVFPWQWSVGCCHGVFRRVCGTVLHYRSPCLLAAARTQIIGQQVGSIQHTCVHSCARTDPVSTHKSPLPRYPPAHTITPSPPPTDFSNSSITTTAFPGETTLT